MNKMYRILVFKQQSRCKPTIRHNGKNIKKHRVGQHTDTKKTGQKLQSKDRQCKWPNTVYKELKY